MAGPKQRRNQHHQGRITPSKRQLEAQRDDGPSPEVLQRQLERSQAALNEFERGRVRRTALAVVASVLVLAVAGVGSWLLSAAGPLAAAVVLIAAAAVAVMSFTGGEKAPAVARSAEFVLPGAASAAAAVDLVVLSSLPGAVIGALGALGAWMFVSTARRQFQPLEPLGAKYKALLAKMPVEVVDDPGTGMTVVVLPNSVSGAVTSAAVGDGEDPLSNREVLSFVSRVSQVQRMLPAELGLTFGGLCIVENYDGPVISAGRDVWCCAPGRVGSGLAALGGEL